MYKGTTPAIPIRFKNAILTEAKVYITLYDEQKKVQYDFVSGTDFILDQSGYDTVTTLSLTQEQTLALGNGIVSIQARYVFPDGVAGATQREGIQIQDVLKKDVIEYGDD